MKPRNGRVTYAESPSDLNQRLALSPSRQSLLPLIRGELELAAEFDAASFGTLAPFIGSRSDQLAFEFRQAAEHCQHQPSVGSRILRCSILTGEPRRPGPGAQLPPWTARRGAKAAPPTGEWSPL